MLKAPHCSGHRPRVHTSLLCRALKGTPTSQTSPNNSSIDEDDYKPGISGRAVLESLELLSIAGAVGFQAHHSFISSRPSLPAAAATAPTPSTHTPAALPSLTIPTIAPMAANFLAAAVILGAISRRVGSADDSFDSEFGVGRARVAPEAAARLAAVEALVRRQQESLASTSRVLEKINIRTSYMRKDVQDPLKRTEVEVLRQGEVLVQVADRAKALEDELRATQELIGALQGLGLKQFELVTQVVKRQGALEESLAAVKKAQVQVQVQPRQSAAEKGSAATNSDGEVELQQNSKQERNRTRVQQNDHGGSGTSHAAGQSADPWAPRASALDVAAAQEGIAMH